MPGEQQGMVLTCTLCGSVVELCAFCERDGCGQTICYRCLRIQLGQSIAHLHVHGG